MVGKHLEVTRAHADARVRRSAQGPRSKRKDVAMAKARTRRGVSITAERAARISVQDFTESVFSGVLRAIEARKPGLRGPIIYGIIFDPRIETGGIVGGFRGPISAPGSER